MSDFDTNFDCVGLPHHHRQDLVQRVPVKVFELLAIMEHPMHREIFGVALTRGLMPRTNSFFDDLVCLTFMIVF